MPVWEAVKSQKWWAGSPTVVTYIHRLSSPLGTHGYGSGLFDPTACKGLTRITITFYQNVSL